MTDPAPYDPYEPLGGGRTIIEASAGTGKTFTIAATVARLVATEGIDLDRILVVTFTRAATAELKDRVRKRMVECLARLEGRGPGWAPDIHMQAFLEGADPGPATHRLRQALSDFDRAQIFTIHGFAQRLLGQLGLRVRLPETLEPGEIDAAVINHAASDLLVAGFSRNPDRLDVPTLKTAAKIAREILGHPDAMVVPAPESVTGSARTRSEVASAISVEVRRRMRAANTMTFDDGLIEVRDVLCDPKVGEGARRLLRDRYEIGLVDESQDTDPMQWQIIRQVFNPARLVVIGDPKQSIYSFRGADIESYLAAAEGATAIRTLGTNWRSDGPLIDALDLLFAGVSFGDDRIRYHRVSAAQDHRDARIAGVVAPLVVRRLGNDLPLSRRQNGCYIVGAIRDTVASDAAAQVVELLSGGVSITDPEGEVRPLSPGHIAILCRTRRQVEMIRSELGRRGVPSVTSRTVGVFTTKAAEEWRRFLLGVERPDRMDLVRLAATTSLVGCSLAEIAALDDAQALALQEQVRGWHDILMGQGVPALLAALNQGTGLSRRVLALGEGERIMTDLVHIAEEMHAVWRRGRIGSLLAWLETTMAEAQGRASDSGEEPESRQRRLETDADAVTVQTVHGAKGLEYPVVLVPFAWDPPFYSVDIPVFHEPAASVGDEPRRRLIDVGGEGWADFTDHRRLAVAEQEAEEARLLYVALTRARHHLMIWWVEKHARIDEAKLTELLTGGDRSPDGLMAEGRGLIESPVVSELPPLRPYIAPPAETPPLSVAALTRPLDLLWRRASFSSLSAGQPLAVAEDHAETRLVGDEAEPGVDLLVAAPEAGLPMAELPGGARFGTLVHEILEKAVFDAEDLPALIRELVEAEMRRSGWVFDIDAFVNGMVAATETPLGPEAGAVRLRDLNRALRELSFELPVHTAGQGAVSLVDIGRVMAEHLSEDDPYRRYADELAGTEPQPFRGYLTGAIDLVAVIDGRYVVMDYKSNLLPARGQVPSPLDYGPEALAEAMVDDRYVLQATLYQVALHRYLQWRLPGYDPSTHLGGSIYLFIRGMIGPDTPVVDGERCGVARWSPSPSMITVLSHLFIGDLT